MRVALRSLRASGGVPLVRGAARRQSPLASALATIKSTVSEIMPEPARPEPHPTSWNQVADRTASIMFMGDVFHGRVALDGGGLQAQGASPRARGKGGDGRRNVGVSASRARARRARGRARRDAWRRGGVSLARRRSHNCLLRVQVTINYPFEKGQLSPRFRGEHALRRYPRRRRALHRVQAVRSGVPRAGHHD